MRVSRRLMRVSQSGHVATGDFSEADIQSSRVCGDQLIRHINAISGGEEESWNWTGNACNLKLSKLGAEIACLWDESMPVCRVGLNEMHDAALGWIQLISSRNEPSTTTNQDRDSQLGLPFND